MYWFFTVLLIVVSAATVVFACYLVRRLFTTKPAAVDVAGAVDVTDVAAESQS